MPSSGGRTPRSSGREAPAAVKLNARGPDSRRLGEDTIELIRRLAEHHTDPQIAAILSRQGYRTGTGLPFTEARVRGARFRAGIPAAPAPDPHLELVTIQQAAAELNLSTHTIRRWLDQGLLPGEQALPGAAWRIRLTDVAPRITPLLDVLRATAPAEPDVAAFLAHMEDARRQGPLELLGRQVPPDTWRPGLTPDELADIVSTLASPDTLRSLIDRCGWDDAAAVAWIVRVLERELLGE